MAEWWQNLLGGEPPSGGLNTINYGLKAIPELTSPVELGRNSIKAISESNPLIASFTEGLPDSILTSTINAFGQNPAKGGELLASFMGTAGLAGAANMLFPPKPVPPISEGQTVIAEQSFSVGTRSEDPTRKAESILNGGYNALNGGEGTKVELGPLRFEVPPAMSTVNSVHGGMGTVAPGAGSGISIRHVQNISTMPIPGSVPLYQSLGIQGQMIEFVGAFLGFDPNVYHDASIHMVNKGSNVLRDDSPDPFYKEYSGKAGKIANNSGVPYGMSNAGSWAVSRAFEAHIRRGEPMLLVIDTGVVTIKYNVLVAGFDRMYQRDDRTWYKIQGMVVGSAEWVANAAGGGVYRPKPDGPSKVKRGRVANKGDTRKRAAARRTKPVAAGSPGAAKAKVPSSAGARKVAEPVALARKIEASISAFSAELDRLTENTARLIRKVKPDTSTVPIDADKYSKIVGAFNAMVSYRESTKQSINRDIEQLKSLEHDMGGNFKVLLKEVEDGKIKEVEDGKTSKVWREDDDTRLRQFYTDDKLKKRIISALKQVNISTNDPIKEYSLILTKLKNSN